MKKKPLSQTNRYLVEDGRGVVSIATSAATSTSIEGVHVKFKISGNPRSKSRISVHRTPAASAAKQK
jgi:hypothetical protein